MITAQFSFMSWEHEVSSHFQPYSFKIINILKQIKHCLHLQCVGDNVVCKRNKPKSSLSTANAHAVQE